MTLADLIALKIDGKFHHATYRDHGTLWEGLAIYRKENGPTGFRGFIHHGTFYKDSPELEAAIAECAESGVHIGSYGSG